MGKSRKENEVSKVATLLFLRSKLWDHSLISKLYIIPNLFLYVNRKLQKNRLTNYVKFYNNVLHRGKKQ